MSLFVGFCLMALVNPAYAQMFVDVFETVGKAEDVTIAHIGESLAAYIALDFQSRDSDFDKLLACDLAALNAS